MTPRTRNLIVAAGVIIALLVAGYIVLERRAVAAEYSLALEFCEADNPIGAARIKRLDSEHGESARPSELVFDISMCLAAQAISDLERLSRSLGGN